VRVAPAEPLTGALGHLRRAGLNPAVNVALKGKCAASCLGTGFADLGSVPGSLAYGRTVGLEVATTFTTRPPVELHPQDWMN